MTALAPSVAEKLQRINPDFVTDEFLEALLRRERFRMATDRLVEMATDAENERLAALRALADGEAGALDRLVDAAGRLSAVDAAARAVPPPQMQEADVVSSIGAATAALIAARMTFDHTPLAASEERSAWQIWCGVHHVVTEPPVVNDEERWLQGAVEDFALETAGWHSSAAAWFSVRQRGGSDSLDLLGAASDLVGQSGEFAKRAAEIDERVRAANFDRRQGGHTWVAPR